MGVLVLAGAPLEWLRGNIADSILPDDLERAYSFHHELNVNRELEEAVVVEERATPMVAYDGVRWKLAMREAAGKEVFDMPMTRKVLADYPMWHQNECGSVAVNCILFINSEFQRQGLATRIYEAEEALYRKWNIREIQIEAVQLGPEVWVKLGFKPRYPQFLKRHYRSWASLRGLPATLPQRLCDYPGPFLRSLGTLELFKVLS